MDKLLNFIFEKSNTTPQEFVNGLYSNGFEPWFNFVGGVDLWQFIAPFYAFLSVIFFLIALRAVRLVPKNYALPLVVIRLVSLLALLSMVFFFFWSMYAWAALWGIQRLGFSLDVISGVSWDVFVWGLSAAGIAFFLGFYFWYWLGSDVEPALARTFALKRSDDGLSDVRELHQESFKVSSFENLSKIANNKNSIFLGMGTNKKPVLMAFDEFLKKNFQIVGAPGAGKGVFGQEVFGQIYGRVKAFVFDPKCDRYLTSFFASKGAYFLDLRKDLPQVDLLGGSTQQEAINCLIEAFALKEKGAESDVYQLEEQEAIREIFGGVSDYSFRSLSMYAAENQPDARKVAARLRSLSRIKALAGGVTLEELLIKNDAIYLVFDESDEVQKLAARVAFARINQIKKARRFPEHLTVFADEFIHLVSKSSVNALGLMRDYGVNYLVAHQSLGDFEASFPDVTSKEARQRVHTNTQIKVVYRQNEDAKYWADQTGFKTFEDVSALAESNEVSGDVMSDSGRISMRQRQLIDQNEFLMLGDQVAVLIGAGVARKVKTLPPLVEVRPFEINRIERTAAPSNDLRATEDLEGLAATESTESVPLSAPSAATKKRTAKDIEEIEL